MRTWVTGCKSPVGRPVRRRRFDRGFTLIELLVVVGLIALAAGLIVPRMGGHRARRELRQCAGQLAYTARSLRELAIARQQVFALEMDLDDGGYGALMQSSEDGATELEPLMLSWIKAGQWPAGVRVSEYRTPDGMIATRGQQQVRFFRDGRSSGASIRLEGPDSEYIVVVHPATGRVDWGSAATTTIPQDSIDLGD